MRIRALQTLRNAPIGKQQPAGHRSPRTVIESNAFGVSCRRRPRGQGERYDRGAGSGGRTSVIYHGLAGKVFQNCMFKYLYVMKSIFMFLETFP